MNNIFQNQLAKAFVCRKINHWELFSLKDEIKSRKIFYDPVPHGSTSNKYGEDELFVIRRAGYSSSSKEEHLNRLRMVKEFLDIRFVGVREVLLKFQGKVVLAGGIFTAPRKSRDVDLFFTNCTPEEAEEIMIQSSIIIEAARKRKYPNNTPIEKMKSKLTMTRTKNTTNLHFVNMHYEKYKYQFIHRIYPSIGHVLGGFDVQASMIAYDGKTFWTTEAGLWSFLNQTIVVDISRRSPSFAFRLMKCRNRGYNLVFPGCNHNDGYRDLIEISEKEGEFHKNLQELMKKYQIIAHYTAPDYEGGGYYRGESSTKHLFRLEKSGVTQEGEVYGEYPIFTDIIIRSDARAEKCITNALHVRQEGEIGDYEIGDTFQDNPELAYLAAISSNSPQNMFTMPITVDAETIRNHFKQHAFYPTIDVNKIAHLMEEHRYHFSNYLDKYFPKDYDFEAEFPDFDHRFLRVYEDLSPDYTDLKVKLWEKIAMFVSMRQKAFEQDMSTINWLTQDPQQQWTSTVHPEVLSAQKYYKGKWNGCCVILDSQVETLLRLARRDPTNPWRHINRDMFNKIVMMIPYLD